MQCGVWPPASFIRQCSKVHPCGRCPLLTNTIPLQEDAAFSLPVHLLGDIWVVSTMWCYGHAAVNTLRQVSCGRTFSFVVGIYPGVDLTNRTVTLWLTVWGPIKLSCTVTAPFYEPCLGVSTSAYPDQQ